MTAQGLNACSQEGRMPPLFWFFILLYSGYFFRAVYFAFADTNFVDCMIKTTPTPVLLAMR